MHAVTKLSSIVVLAIAAFLPGVAAAQPAFDLNDFDLGDPAPAEEAPPAKLSATLKTTDTPHLLALTVTAELPPGFYIYSTKPFVARTRIEITSSPGLIPEGAWEADRKPKIEKQEALDGGFEDVEKFYDRVSWTQRMRIVESAKSLSVAVKVNGQYCSAGEGGECRFLKDSAEATLEGDFESETVLKAFPNTLDVRPVQRTGKPYPGAVRATLLPEDAQPGETVTLSLTITLDDDWHTYSTTQQGIGASPTVIEVAEVNGLTPLGDGFEPTEPSENHFDEILENTLEEHHGEVTWTREFKVDDAEFGTRGSISFQTCREGNCLRATTSDFELGTLPVSTIDDESQPPRVAKVPVPEKPLPPKDPALVETVDETATATAPGSEGLIAFVIAAAAAGFLALLTPCTFPMIPITVSFFLKQAEKQSHRPVAMASVYVLGIIGTFSILGVLMAAIFGALEPTQVANNPWLNLFIAGVLVFFGFNLLGLFEIRMPSWLINWSSGQESGGGYVGVLFMALTFTLVSFTCTFAFVGGLLVVASRGDFLWPILGMLAFSTAFATPFFFLALFPSFLQKLPKSGGWMNTVKVTMGLIECGAAFKFLSVADLSWSPTRPMFFDAAVVLSAWMVLCIAAGLYLLGLFRTAHDTPTDSVSVPRLAFALTFLGFGAYLGTGLYSTEKPDGYVWEQIASYLPQATEVEAAPELGPVKTHDGLEYALDVDRALEVARETGKPLFYDFTGINCANCRVMEKRMEQTVTRKLLENYVRVALYLDQVPVPDENERERILDRNLTIAESELKDVSMPAYAVVTPDGEIMWSVAPIKGVADIERFNDFLERGLGEWERMEAAKGADRMARR